MMGVSRRRCQDDTFYSLVAARIRVGNAPSSPHRRSTALHGRIEARSRRLFSLFQTTPKNHTIN